MTGVRFVVPASLTLALALCGAVASCFSRPLFGGGVTYSYPGVDPNTPIEPMPPSDNASPALTGFGAHRPPDAGADSPNHGD